MDGTLGATNLGGQVCGWSGERLVYPTAIPYVFSGTCGTYVTDPAEVYLGMSYSATTMPTQTLSVALFVVGSLFLLHWNRDEDSEPDDMATERSAESTASVSESHQPKVFFSNIQYGWLVVNSHRLRCANCCPNGTTCA